MRFYRIDVQGLRPVVRHWLRLGVSLVVPILALGCSKAPRYPGVVQAAMAANKQAMSLPSVTGKAAATIALRTVSAAKLSQLTGGDSIQAAVADGSGHVVLLDVPRSRLVITDTALHVTGAVPWRDAGVTHLWDPVALGLTADRRVAVLDRRTHEITYVSVSENGRSLSWGPAIKVNLRTVEGFCPLEHGTFLVYGLRNGMRLHVVDGRSGVVLRSFAPTDSALQLAAQVFVTKGPIACSVRADKVVMTTSFLPDVQAYHISDDKLVWTDQLRPFRGMIFRQNGQRVILGSGAAGYSRVIDAFFVDGALVVQSALTAKLGERAGEPDTVVTYIYPPGGMTNVQTDLTTPNLMPIGKMKALAIGQGSDANVQLVELTAPGTPDGRR
jgi:hypothetical protein